MDRALGNVWVEWLDEHKAVCIKRVLSCYVDALIKRKVENGDRGYECLECGEGGACAFV